TASAARRSCGTSSSCPPAAPRGARRSWRPGSFSPTSALRRSPFAQPWIDTSIDFARVRSRLPELTAYFSDDDPYVSLDNQSLFEQRLAARTHLLKGLKHMGVESGMTTFPELLATTLKALG